VSVGLGSSRLPTAFAPCRCLGPTHSPVSRYRSSNRTCGFPAYGSRTERFTRSHTESSDETRADRRVPIPHTGTRRAGVCSPPSGLCVSVVTTGGADTSRGRPTRDTPCLPAQGRISRPAQRSLALRPAYSPSCFSQPSAPEASADSLPPRLLRLLPAGTTPTGWELHPLKDRAFARHTATARLC